MTASTLGSGAIRWTDVPNAPIADGITGRTVAGEFLSTTVFELDPGALIPRHAHRSEELGVVLRGSLRVVCGGAEHVVRAGESFFVAGDQPHSGNALDEGCTLLECYSPPRMPAPASESVAR